MTTLLSTRLHARLATLALLASPLAGCEFAKNTETSGAGAQCLPVAAACARNADCCSYGCSSGTCSPNPNEGGACKTTGDCLLGLCKSGGCQSLATCRDDVDACSYDDQCCSGNCVGATNLSGGQCKPNQPPVVDLGANREIPYHQPYQVPATVSDPDGDTLVYGWTLVPPAGSGAVLSSQTDASVSFTPDIAGPYLVTLAVTDGYSTQPTRITVRKTVTLVAGNTVPVVDAGQPVAAASRNNPVLLSGSATDADGDALTCTWKTAAPGATSATVIAGPAACAGTTTASFTPGAEGAWTATLEVSDGVHTTAASTTVECVNDPPSPVVSRSPYYANMGATVGSTPPVNLDASPSTDKNGDTLSFAWTWKSYPGAAPPPLSVTNTAQTSFTPGQAGTYVLTVTVTDPAWNPAPTRGGASTSADVTVYVGTYVKPLGHAVVDAEYAKAANKILLVGPDPATTSPNPGMLWIYDPAAGAESSVALAKAPLSLSVSADGHMAAVGHNSFFSIVDLSGQTPAVNLYNGPAGDVTDIVLNRGQGNSRLVDLFVAGRVTVWSAIDGTRQGLSGMDYAGETGRLHPSQDVIYLLENGYYSYLHKYSTGTSLGWQADKSLTYSANHVWVHENGAKLFLSDGTMFDSALSSGTTFYAGYIAHMDTISRGDATVLTGSRVVRFDNALNQLTGDDTVPIWGGADGEYHGEGGEFVFLELLGTGNTRRHVIVRSAATAQTPERWGIATFTP